MSEHFASAFVSVQAELEKGFRANLRDRIKRSIGAGFDVPLRPKLAPFRGQLQKELNKRPILIPVKPNVEILKFRAELQRKVDQASKGVVARVPVVTGRVTTAAAAGTGAAGAAISTGASEKVTRQTKERVKVEEKLDDLIVRRTRAQTFLTRADEEGLDVQQRLQRLAFARSEAEAGVRAAITASNRDREKEFQKIADTAAAEQKRIRTTEKSLALRAQADQAIRRGNALLNTELTSIRTREALQTHRNSQLRVEAQLKDISTRAQRLGNTELARETRELRENLIARQQGIAARRTELRETTAFGRRREAALRGAAATGLSFAGVRGATLAAGGPFLAGAAAVAISAKAIQSAAQLEQELNVLRITARATAAEMEQVRTASIELGRDVSLPAVTATDAAVAMNQLVRAGLDVQNAIAGARGVLQLATAAQIDFTTATNLTASALNAFKLQGEDATHVADVFTNAANASQASIEEMGVSLQQASAAAAITGISFEDTVALLTLLSRAGLRGSDAGTSLRTALIRLVNPTKKASELIKQLGLDLRDSQGSIRPEVFGEFSQATANLTRQQRQQAAAIIFGADAFRTIAITSREGVAGLEAVRTELERTGSAAELAGARATGFSGKVSALASNMQTLGSTVGSFVLEPMGSLVDLFNELVKGTTDVVVGLDKAIKKLGEWNDEISESIPGGEKTNEFITEFFKFGATPGLALTRSIKEMRKGWGTATKDIMEDADRARAAVSRIFTDVGQGPVSAPAVNAVVVQIREIIKSLEKGDEEAQAFAATLRDVLNDIVQTGQIPLDIQIRLDKDIARREGLTTGETILQAFHSLGPQFRAEGLFAIEQLGEGMKEGVTKLNLGGGGLSLDTQAALADVTGDEDERLRLLRQQLANTTQQRIRQQQLVATGRRPDLQDELQDTIAREKQLQDDIDQILEGRKSDAEEAKRDAERAAKDALDAQKERDEARLSVFDANRQKAQNKLTIAQATEGLDDDIKATVFLRKLVTLQISRIKDQIKTGELKKEAIQQLAQFFFELGQDLNKLREERKKTLNDQIRRGLELDIEFAETTENVGLERRARNRLIANLQKELDVLTRIKKKTIEQKNRMKEIRNEIAAQRKELQGIVNDRRKIFAEMSFAFLTTQQGFFANLMGNLLPFSAIGGTLGGSAPRGASGAFTGGGGSFGGPSIPIPGSRGAFPEGRPGGPRPEDRITEASRIAAAQATGGFTAAQAATLIFLTKQIVQLLGGIDGKGKHPENKRQTRMTGGSMDSMPS